MDPSAEGERPPGPVREYVVHLFWMVVTVLSVGCGLLLWEVIKWYFL